MVSGCWLFGTGPDDDVVGPLKPTAETYVAVPRTVSKEVAEQAGSFAEEIRTGIEPSGISEDDDYWLRIFGPYLTPGFVRRYLSTREEERFVIHGETFLDLQRREALLKDHFDLLDADGLRAFYGQPTFEASKKFIDERLKKRR